ncbi:MAG: hypothetical protein WB952_22870 [Terriglobales bacterium]
MQIRKPRFTREKEDKVVACLRQLRREGLDVDIPEESEESALKIIVAGTGENTVLETARGAIIYAVPMRLIAFRSVTLMDCDLSTVYDKQIVLEPFDHQNPVYKAVGLEYQQREVLNEKIENLSLSRGEILEGWLVGTGCQRVPAKYGHLAAPFEVVFFDSFGEEFRAEGKLSVARMPRIRIVRKKGSLYEGAMPAPELSIGQESSREYRELIAEEKRRKEATARPDSEAGGATPGCTAGGEPGRKKR